MIKYDIYDKTKIFFNYPLCTGTFIKKILLGLKTRDFNIEVSAIKRFY